MPSAECFVRFSIVSRRSLTGEPNSVDSRLLENSLLFLSDQAIKTVVHRPQGKNK